MVAAFAWALLLAVPASASQEVVIDGRDDGRRFDGVGGLSAGGSSRLLVDYPRRERDQILDYLFKPSYGAALDILKVEIGGDTDSTAGAEASHMRTRDEVDCDRGYEWWLMREAKERNPEIELYALQWGAPGWFEGGYWSQDNVDYVVAWLDCARRNGFEIDYLGGANESGYDAGYYKALDAGLEAAGHGDVRIVASDEHRPPDYWHVAEDMIADPEFAAAVDILGEHDVCHWRTTYDHCDVSAAALALGKPLWDSEQSTEDYADWAKPLARAMNRHYIDARVTGNINWAAASAFYANFPAAGTGLILADRPWSGYYDLGQAIWVDAHTTQFTEPGWRYLDGAAGYLDGGSSHVALRSPESGDYTVVIETVDATAPETVTFRVGGGLSAGTVHLWSTNLDTPGQGDDFVHERELDPAGGSFTLTLDPGRVYTLSTTTGQAKGGARSTADPGAQMPVPHREDFERTGVGGLARYFSDVNGAFEAAPCGGDRSGTCYRQVVTRAPIAWHGHVMPPTTMVGDPRWWGDYEVSTDALLEEPGYVELLGRVEAQLHLVAGYHLRVADDGAWRLYTVSISGTETTLASGVAAAPGTGSWHRLALRFRGDEITASLDGQELATVRDGQHRTGQAGLRVSGWHNAQFDDVRVVPTGPWPRFVPHSEMTATATTAHALPYQGMTFPAVKAIDDRPESMWHSQFQPSRAPLPQSLTLDLGRPRSVHGLTYQPRLDGVFSGLVTGYDVYVSLDGETFEKVSSGGWAATVATKVAAWPEPVSARYVRLTATAGESNLAAAGEVGVATTPIAGDLPPGLHLVPREQMTATATSAAAGFPPVLAIDGDGATFWHSEFQPREPLPQAITVDLGREYEARALTYRPRNDNGSGRVTRYEVHVSRDGAAFSEVASGEWKSDASTKTALWRGGPPARYVRLVAVAGENDLAAAAEIAVAHEGDSG